MIQVHATHWIEIPLPNTRSVPELIKPTWQLITGSLGTPAVRTLFATIWPYMKNYFKLLGIPQSYTPLLKQYLLCPPHVVQYQRGEPLFLRIPAKFDLSIDKSGKHIFETEGGMSMKIRVLPTPRRMIPMSLVTKYPFYGLLSKARVRIRMLTIKTGAGTPWAMYTKPDPKKPTPKNNSKK